MVVKAYESAFADNWARESAALTVLRGRGLPVPNLIVAVREPPLVVLEDVGAGPSLADALLGDDPATATARLSAWVDALARLHVATTGDRGHFAALLDTDPSTVDMMPALLAGAADQLAELLPSIGVEVDGVAWAELRSATAALSPGADSLTPSDACPDNNVSTPEGLVLLDFEHATVRHVAWDAAYLRVPWPSCWCSWNLPTAVADAALARWRGAVAPAIPIVGTPAFDRDLEVAVSAWAFLSLAWFLPGALQGAAHRRQPKGLSRQVVIQARMRQAASHGTVLPALAELAAAVLAETRERWGDLRFDVAPAYR